MTNKDIQKIRSLIWSNAPVNELLALEIIKTHNLSNILLPELVAVAKTALEQQVRKDFLVYLSAVLPKHQFQKIANSKFSTTHNKIGDLIGAVQLDNMLYTYFKRTGKGVEEFLKYPSLQSSKYRKEAVANYLDQIKLEIERGYTNYYLWISHLTFEELEKAFQDKVIGSFPWQKIVINNSPLTDIPPSLTKVKTLHSLAIHTANFVEFPHSVFQFTNLKELSLGKLHGITLPKDWSALSNLTQLDFGSSQLRINDFTFLNTLPKLEQLDLHDCKLSNKYLLMHKKKLPIKNWTNFRHLSPFPLDGFLAYASALKRSSLSRKDQEYFFNLAFLRKSFKELPDLTLTNLLKALSINCIPLKTECFKRLEKWISEKRGIESLQKGSTLHMIGNSTLGKV